MAEFTEGVPSDDEVQTILAERKRPPTSAGTSPMTRFMRAAAKLVHDRHASGNTKGHSVIILSSTPTETLMEFDGAANAIQTATFKSGSSEMDDHIWIVNPSLLRATGCAMGTPFSEMIGRIEASNLGGLPTIIVEWTSARPFMGAYPTGMRNPDDSVEVKFADEPITSDEVQETLNQLHSRALETPFLLNQGNQESPWNDAGKAIPKSQAEILVHWRVHDCLAQKFAHDRFDVRSEADTAKGRLDLQLCRWFDGGPGFNEALTCDGVLELKVLRSKTSGGNPVSDNDNEKNVAKGLIQAHQYRSEKKADWVALCCYDMRATQVANPNCLDKFATQAAADETAIWYWPLRQNAEAARDQAYAIAQNAGA
ncbi:hypothetical protein [Maricaulis sp.]|uniref:hypothetical protein n=1 Tax=Maricaulis sp. TaxID=1486257 RepID=UPI002606DCE8|nr:hypothetical protein [Maricaulis sp.]